MVNRSGGIILGVGVLVWAATGCGPKVSEVRMVPAPGRDENCALEFVKVDLGALSSPTSEWEMLGQIVLQEHGIQDPFAEKYRAIVRPRACAMGGEAVGIVLSATSETLTSSGSTTSYGVLRKRKQDSAAPKSF